MSNIELISSLSGITGVASAAFGVWYSLKKINDEKSKSEFERGKMSEQIEHHKESICRAFKEIENVKEDHRKTSDTVIAIMTGIEYLKMTMDDVKKSLDKLAK